ncbi:hypothetical protein CL615_03445 [archaeon]|nr:hypothetical protein [archaeon]
MHFMTNKSIQVGVEESKAAYTKARKMYNDDVVDRYFKNDWLKIYMSNAVRNGQLTEKQVSHINDCWDNYTGDVEIHTKIEENGLRDSAIILLRELYNVAHEHKEEDENIQNNIGALTRRIDRIADGGYFSHPAYGNTVNNILNTLKKANVDVKDLESRLDNWELSKILK